MPIKAYFKGKGDEVMKDMKKKYGAKKGKSVFYGKAKMMGMGPMSHGSMAMPKDIGVARQEESVKVGGFKAGKTVSVSAAFKSRGT